MVPLYGKSLLYRTIVMKNMTHEMRWAIIFSAALLL